MGDTFISYSRLDKEFVDRLHRALADRQESVRVDWEDFPQAADLNHELAQARQLRRRLWAAAGLLADWAEEKREFDE